MEQMQQLLLSTACYEIEKFMYREGESDIADLLAIIITYCPLLPRHLFEPLISFIYGELNTACNLLEGSPEIAEIEIAKKLISDFECLRQNLFHACNDNKLQPLVEFN